MSDDGQMNRADSVLRNGLSSAIGVVLGFLLTFFGVWSFTAATNDGTGWSGRDVVFASLLLAGIASVAWALKRNLLPHEQDVAAYDRNVTFFMNVVFFNLMILGGRVVFEFLVHR